VEAAQDGTYKPLSRPLFIYAKTTSLERQEVRDFLSYMLDNATEIAEAAQYVPLTEEQAQKSRDALEAA
jgi:phosphate transport system substrate-binding protein